MSEYKKPEIGEEIRRFHNKRNSTSRDNKAKVGGLRKGVFLTDAQTSDYTKSSGEMHVLKIEYLEEANKELRQQNKQLKQTILDIKANQFFKLNEDKFKEFIKQTQKLKNQLSRCKSQLEESIIERDFLARFNSNLKNECESLSKELLYLRKHVSDLKKNNTTSRHKWSTEELKYLPSRSSSADMKIINRREKIKTEHEENPIYKVRNRHQLNQQYFIGRSSKNKIIKSHSRHGI